VNGQSDKTLALSEEMSRALAGVDLSDPTQRTAAALFVVLKSQLDMLGYRPGTVPFDARFGSDRCRGALMGTAVAVLRGHREAPEREHYIDAIAAAFMIVFGEQIGRAKALETIEMSADRNEVVNAASDWAGQDTIDTWSDDSPSTPMAYYRAATESAGGVSAQ
jgi:hypothetical protein